MTGVASAVPDGFEALAREALAEVTPRESVGGLLGADRSADDVTDLAFASRLPGYADWRWTVSMVQLPDDEPSVLEVELLPGDGALLAPPWVPWAERLAEYRRTHPDDAELGDADEDLDEDDELDADEDVLDDEADEVLDGIDFEAPTDADEDDADEDDEDDNPAGFHEPELTAADEERPQD